MCAVGEEGIVEVREDDADGAVALSAEGAGQFVGPVVQLLDGSLNALSGLIRDGGCTAQVTGNGHGADPSQARDIGHSRLA